MFCCHFHISKDLGRHFEKNMTPIFCKFFNILKHLSSFFVCFMGYRTHTCHVSQIRLNWGRGLYPTWACTWLHSHVGSFSGNVCGWGLYFTLYTSKPEHPNLIGVWLDSLGWILFQTPLLFLKIYARNKQTNGTNQKKQTKPTRRDLLESQRGTRKGENPSGWLVEALKEAYGSEKIEKTKWKEEEGESRQRKKKNIKYHVGQVCTNWY